MTPRRLWLRGAAAMLAAPWIVRAAPLPPMTEGPFYPSRAWRAAREDWDADLTQVRERGAVHTARGEHLALGLRLADARGRAIDGAEVEIWQCDAQGQYRHPRERQGGAGVDPGFQGFGAARSDGQGQVAFRTIRPVPYTGRTPHIHVRVRHPSLGEVTSQLFVANDPGNERDFLWRQLDAAERSATAMTLERAPGDGLAWRALHRLEMPG
ncbi:MAG: intradiol ring-cleavage dioxygenase [Rubrivivax sp.]|nr:intradiol ring-cleavage dioxygenase [Rubrivivax sp.]